MTETRTMTLYHATNRNYRQGDDLLSLLAQVERGLISDAEAQEIASRWTEANDDYLFQDGAMISLTANREEAEYVRDEFNRGEGLILEIDGDALAEDGLLRKNSEGFPAVNTEILAAYILGVA
jgi:hypothetical protein